MVHKAKGEGEAEEKEIAVDHHLVEEEEEYNKDRELMVIKIQREEVRKKGLKLTFNSSRVPSPASLS